MKINNTITACAYSLSVDAELLCQVIPALRALSQQKAEALNKPGYASKLEHPYPIWILVPNPNEDKK